jgi:hypothetical protein
MWKSTSDINGPRGSVGWACVAQLSNITKSIKFQVKIILMHLTSIINVGQSIGELVLWHLKRKKLVSLTICWYKWP